jgi:hypothetical protein
MTNMQQRVVNQIRRDAEKMHSVGNYEIKEWEVIDHEWGNVSVYLEIGLVGDEGTMAQYIGRDKLHIFIGPKGGTRIPCYKTKKDGTFHNYYSKYINIWQATQAYGKH